MALHSWPWFSVRASAPIAETEDAGQADDDRAQRRIQRRGNQIARRHLRVGWQPVDFRFVDAKEERVDAREHLVVGAVEIRPVLAGPVQLLDPCLRSLSKLAYGAELNGLRRTGLRAGRLHATLQPVVTERALLRRVRDRVDVDDTKRAGRDAVAAAIARVRLDDDGVELGADDRPGGADLKTRGVDAVLAHIAHQQPSAVLTVLGELLDELDVAPMRAIEPASVVIAVAAQRVDAAVGAGQLIPFLAGDLAGLAADAHGRVCVKSHRLTHNSLRSSHAFSILQTKAFPS